MQIPFPLRLEALIPAILGRDNGPAGRSVWRDQVRPNGNDEWSGHLLLPIGLWGGSGEGTKIDITRRRFAAPSGSSFAPRERDPNRKVGNKWATFALPSKLEEWSSVDELNTHSTGPN